MRRHPRSPQTGGKVEALCGAHVKPTRHARRPVCPLCVDLQLALTNPTIWTYPAMPTPTTFSTNTQILHPRMYA